MRELIEKFIQVERTLTEEKGEFALFALFLREDAGAGSGTSGSSGYSAKWDLIAAADWIEGNRKAALSYITKMLQQALPHEELARLSRIVLVNITNPEVEAINQAVQIQHGDVEIRDSFFFGLQIKHAYIITSQRSNINEQIPA